MHAHQARALAWVFVITMALIVATTAACDRPPSSPDQAPMASSPLTTPTQMPIVSPIAATAFETPIATLSPATISQATTAISGSAIRECVDARARHYARLETHYRLGGVGPTYFDCTGLVYRVFADCSATDLIGAEGEQTVRDYHDWFAARRRADARSPQIGDLVVYGLDFAHIAVYTGDGRAISALLDGVREHDATQLGSGTSGEIMELKAYLHIQAQ